MRKILIALVVLPLAAFGQTAAPGAGKQQGAPQAQRGPGGPGAQGFRPDPQRIARRIRLARTLGLAEALDLEPADALKLGDQLAKNDEKRIQVHQQLRDANQTLRRAATGEKVTLAEVDGAIQRILQGRNQLDALDREAVQTITKDLSPEKRARAVLFLERFQHRFAGMGGGMHGGMGGPGQGRGFGPGRGGMGSGRGMGPGMGGGMGMGPGAGMGPGMMAGNCPDCPWADDGD